MKFEDVADSVTRFFNDLIGGIVPSVVLVSGLVVLHRGVDVIGSTELLDSAFFTLCAIGVLFALGHAILSLHEKLLMVLFDKIGFVKRFDERKAAERASFRLFERVVQKTARLKLENEALQWGFHDLRSVAMSVSSAAETLGHRFTFISLLCNGTGTALLLLAIDFLVCRQFMPDLLATYPVAPHWAIQIVLLVMAAALLFKRAEVFYARAMTTPFAVAVSVLAFERKMESA